jgi:hypothetical protein
LLVAGIWLTEGCLKLLYGDHGHSLFGVVPLGWLFDVMDLCILLLFIGWGLVEANRELRGDWAMAALVGSYPTTPEFSFDRAAITRWTRWLIRRFVVYLGVALVSAVVFGVATGLYAHLVSTPPPDRSIVIPPQPQGKTILAYPVFTHTPKM